MIRIIGERGSGKTTKLIERAGINPNGYCIVEPTLKMADYVERMAKEKGVDVEVISAYELFNHRHGREKKYLVDELDMFLEMFDIVGYTNGE